MRVTSERRNRIDVVSIMATALTLLTFQGGGIMGKICFSVKKAVVLAAVASLGVHASEASAGTAKCEKVVQWIFGKPDLTSRLIIEGSVGYSTTKKTKDRIYVHVEVRPDAGKTVMVQVQFKLANGKWSSVLEERTVSSKKTYDWNRAAVDYRVSCFGSPIPK